MEYQESVVEHMMPNQDVVDPVSFTELSLLALVVYRESANQPYPAKLAVACSIRNRVLRPSWYGHGYYAIITKPEQYTSIIPPVHDLDPGLIRYPNPNDASWLDSLKAAMLVYNGTTADTVAGANYYFDRSMDNNPPSWSKDPRYRHIIDIAAFHFYKGPE